MKALTFIEIDIDHCSLAYGVAPCTAAIGVTGERKCFNSLGTCQARSSFDNEPRTIRFSTNSAHYAEAGIDAIPLIEDLSISPATVSLGENIGQRASVSVTLGDMPWPDIGDTYDKYRAEREYDPNQQGSYWGKFRARNPSLRGRPLRVIQGVVGGALETRHYFIESFSGPNVNGRYTITAKDPLKFFDGDRAQAPRISNGFLIGDISEAETSISLNPTGIGNLEYPASGLAAIGGTEIVSFTRSGDTLTIVRAQQGTEAQEHSAGDRVQLCRVYTGADAADIIHELATLDAGVPASLIDLDAWRDETAAFLRRLYSAVIAEPTSVAKLISELVEQGAMALWWDDVAGRIRLQVLRQISTDAATYDEGDYFEQSLSSQDQPNKRLSEVWTYYAQINPLRPVDDPDNYRSIATTVDLQSETDEGTPAIKKIFSRWTPAGGRLLALRVNDIQLGRYRVAPRRVSFDLFRYPQLTKVPRIGQGYRVGSWHFQDATGARELVPIQVTRLAADASRYRLECEEMRFASLDPEDLDNRVIILDSNLNNINIRTIHDLLYPPAEDGDEVTVIIETGTTIWSNVVAVPALHMGSWAPGVTINLIVRGRIQGRAGNGGVGAASRGVPGSPGTNGGRALYTRYPINLVLNEGAGQVWGGGGGGGGGGYGETVNFFGSVSNRTGGGGGGGGQGFIPGTGAPGGQAQNAIGRPGAPGTPDAPGLGGTAIPRGGAGGNGGGPGQAGGNGTPGNTTSGGSGGAPGAAIDGASFVTKTGTGSVAGPEIN